MHFEKKVSLHQKIMKLQRAHICFNLCKSPSTNGIFAYEWRTWNEAKHAFFEKFSV